MLLYLVFREGLHLSYKRTFEQSESKPYSYSNKKCLWQTKQKPSAKTKRSDILIQVEARAKLLEQLKVTGRGKEYQEISQRARQEWDHEAPQSTVRISGLTLRQKSTEGLEEISLSHL